MKNLNLIDNDLKPQFGFTKNEYARLPESVLPTQKDEISGLWDATKAPMRRYKSETPTSSTTDPLIKGYIPISTKDSNLPPNAGIQPTYTGPLIKDELENTVVTDDRQRQIEQEARRQKAQSEQQATYNENQRKTQLTQLGELLSKRSTEQMALEQPGMYEDLNTRGLLRSSELGNSLSRRRAEMETANQNNLAEQALAYGDIGIAEKQAILDRQQGFQTAGTQARLGLEDAEAQKQLAMTLAELSKPSAPQGKSNTEKWVQGIQTATGVGGALFPKGTKG
jgi:hypothetical protein